MWSGHCLAACNQSGMTGSQLARDDLNGQDWLAEYDLHGIAHGWLETVC